MLIAALLSLRCRHVIGSVEFEALRWLDQSRGLITSESAVGVCKERLPHANFAKITHVATVWSRGRNAEMPHIRLHFALVLGTIVDASAASGLRLTCSGSLTNTRQDGVTLGECDLNFLSVSQITEIENVCGIPGTVDTPAENQCRIRATVSPEANRAADPRKLYRVLDVLTVDKR
jgi:hypothetical protein